MEMPPIHTLSKYTFMKGCQCPKILWLHKHQHTLSTEKSDHQQATLEQRKIVGKLTEQSFPKVVDIGPENTFVHHQSVFDQNNNLKNSKSKRI